MRIDLPQCNFKNCRFSFDGNCTNKIEYDRCEYRIAKCDLAEAEPVRHGKWVPLSYDGYTNGYPVYDEWECSECHFACEGEGEPPLNYCPYCGAKLDGGEKE